mmetsp:Transcript_27442/g.80458  ORF Transcript_27442/g.80458 Transcript_27442/m.80458 type:complete len:276 (-) Transcript_27442:159-986(-)
MCPILFEASALARRAPARAPGASQRTQRHPPRLGLHSVLALALLVVLVALLDGHLLLLLLGRVQVDWEVDELGVALDEPLEPLFLEELEAVLLEGEHDLGAAAELLALVLVDGEGRVGGGLPDPLLVVLVRLGVDGDVVGDEVDRVEADAELANQVDVGALLEGLDEGGGARLCDRAEVVDEILLGHAAAAVDEGECLGLLVRDELHLELGGVALAEDRRVRQRHEAHLVERVGSIRDQLTQKDLLLRVQAVDDDVHELVYVRLELVLLAGALLD